MLLSCILSLRKGWFLSGRVSWSYQALSVNNMKRQQTDICPRIHIKAGTNSHFNLYHLNLYRRNYVVFVYFYFMLIMDCKRRFLTINTIFTWTPIFDISISTNIWHQNRCPWRLFQDWEQLWRTTSEIYGNWQMNFLNKMSHIELKMVEYSILL